MDIALDLDGVLADVHTPAIDRSPDLDAFDPDGYDEIDWKEYKHRSYNVWHNHHDEIPLVDDRAPEIVAALYAAHDVTILTHRYNVDDAVREWLSANGIPYDDLLSTRREKGEFEYDAFVDDNPIPGADGHVLLFTRPWNDMTTAGYDDRVCDFDDVRQVLGD